MDSISPSDPTELNTKACTLISGFGKKRERERGLGVEHLLKDEFQRRRHHRIPAAELLTLHGTAKHSRDYLCAANQRKEVRGYLPSEVRGPDLANRSHR
jgi:hypothetical protein